MKRSLVLLQSLPLLGLLAAGCHTQPAAHPTNATPAPDTPRRSNGRAGARGAARIGTAPRDTFPEDRAPRLANGLALDVVAGPHLADRTDSRAYQRRRGGRRRHDWPRQPHRQDAQGRWSWALLDKDLLAKIETLARISYRGFARQHGPLARRFEGALRRGRRSARHVTREPRFDGARGRQAEERPGTELADKAKSSGAWAATMLSGAAPQL